MGATHRNPLQPGAPAPSPNVQTRPRAVQITAQLVQPTLRLYTQDEDILQVAAVANFAGAIVNFGLRWLMPDGQIIPQTITLNIPNAGVIAQLQVAVPEGFLLTAAMFSPTGLAANQWAFASAAILRGGIQGANTFDEFLQGYLSHEYAPSFPDWPPQRSTDGAGVLVSSLIGNPAAGQDFTITVPTLRRWQVLSLRAVLNASVAVANRNVAFLLDDGANTFFSLNSIAAVVASTNERIVASADLPYVNDNVNTQTIPFPSPTILGAGYRIKSLTTNLQAADQWNNIELLVLEWCDLFI